MSPARTDPAPRGPGGPVTPRCAICGAPAPFRIGPGGQSRDLAGGHWYCGPHWRARQAAEVEATTADAAPAAPPTDLFGDRR